MNLIKQLQNLLKQHHCSESVIAHSVAVTKKAVEITDSLNIPIDRELVITGAMLHDLGRSQTHVLNHFLVGGDIAKKEGFDDRVVNVIERHVGAGITKAEATELGLPEKDYLPLSHEEVIVSYSDNLTKGTKHIPFSIALELFKKKLGNNHPAVKRLLEQHEKITKWSKFAKKSGS